MYLKAIELHGFKSFPDKTRVTFEKGMSAVVGPNGSGKSNISDAIRWVLGETRSKELRGTGKMEDIIFGGTQKRNPMGFASVSLILDNKQRNFDVDTDEVSVTRKYYRGGESEYQINSNKVRLKDIYELFLDTGLGRNGYSIVSQGKVSEIVTSKPEDRREIFEEASGIAKFRYKRNEAEKSLSNAQENIIRLADILLGLEDRVEPLRKESEKAKEFVELSVKKKELEISLWLDTVDKSKEIIRQQQRKLEIFKDDYNTMETQLEEKEKYLENRYLQGNSLLAKNDENISAIRLIEQDISEINANKAVFESQINYNTQRQEQLQNEVNNFDVENVSVQDKKNDILINISNLDNQLSKKQAMQEEAENALNEISKKALNADAEKGQYVSSASLFKQKVQDCQLEIYGIETQNKTLGENLHNAKSSLEQNQEYVLQCQKQVDELNEFVHTAVDNITKNNNIKNGLALKLKSYQDKLNKTQESIRQGQSKYSETQSRIKLLTDMENSLEGFALSVKNVLNQSKNGNLGGVLGSVAQIINVEKGYETAIEISLGYALQNIVVENETAAKRGMEYLKTTKGGRATFLPLETIRPSYFKENLPDWARTADTVIKSDSRYANVISNLLGRTVIVDDINQASKLAKTLGYKYKLVTLDGQQINAGGSFTGGSVSKSAGLFTRKGEIEKLKQSLVKIKEEILALEKEFSELKEAQDLINSQIAGCEAENETLNNDKISSELELAKQKQVLSQYISNKELNENIVKNSKLQIEANNQAKLKLDEQVKECQDSLAEIELQLQQLGDTDQELLQTQSEITQQLQQLKLEMVQINGERNLQISNFDILEIQFKQQQERKQNILQDIQDSLKDSEDKQQQIIAINEQVLSLKQDIEKREQENKEFVNMRMEIEQERNLLNIENKKLNNNKEELSKQITKVSERILGLETSYDEIITKLWEEYELTVQSAREFAIEVENENQFKKDLAVIKNNIKKLGSVNVGAIEEYKEVFEKYTFLKEQLKDLELSKNQLLKLITSLNGEMKTLFAESFEIINANFSKIFAELFGGGKASLTLTDPENILESGVEIEVSPPGKVIKSLKSLSGGEQALVAISLYFAILDHSPSPFCVLDEIEAALDDVNVTRYANYLKRISEQTQFIVITHRRGTMEAADILYGVTMQEDGISKLLKLDVNNLSPSIIN